MQPSLSRPQPRLKSALAKRSTAVSLRPLRTVPEPSGRLSVKLLPSNKSVSQHNKASHLHCLLLFCNFWLSPLQSRFRQSDNDVMCLGQPKS